MELRDRASVYAGVHDKPDCKFALFFPLFGHR